jgi:hypothetical protein
MPPGLSARSDGSEQVCIALASRTVRNVAFPAMTTTFPAGVPENCVATATVILTDLSLAQSRPLAVPQEDLRSTRSPRTSTFG